MNRKPLLLVLCALSFLAACQKDSDSPPPAPPVTEPLAIAAAKPGDTLFIQGENFSEAIANNTVKVNGVAATVVVASATELKVLVPANATSGPITVTVNGLTTEVGTLTIVPFTLYSVKSNFQNETIRQVITIDAATGNESVLAPLDENDGVMDDMVYLPATNELIGVSEDVSILRINVTTKQKTLIPVVNSLSMDLTELVVDKYSNLYGIKRSWNNPGHYMHSIVKIDPKTGILTTIKSFEYEPKWESLVYLAATNEIVGIANSSKALFKFNLTTKDTSTVVLHGAFDIECRELVIDNQSNLYAYKGDYSDPDNSKAQIVKLNAANGQETLVSTLTQEGKMHHNLVYVPQHNELASTWDQTGLFRLNLDTKSSSILPLTTQQSITYNQLISN